ncbi:hypothetical protein [Mesorhizobium sp.]|uniref:hypothetical protein n=1 Tax=Mesorhizobium sp. TaxID=1871066 RepID=UPI0025EBF576|nr:hypothetical protein [Mesorhizobium sp.]
MLKRNRQVTLSGGPPSPKKFVTVKLNETAVERRLRLAREEYRYQRELAAWKRTK